MISLLMVHSLQHIFQFLDPLGPEGAVALDPAEKRDNAFRIGPIEGEATRAPLTNKARSFERRQMLRDRGLRDREIALELADRHLARGNALKNGAPGRITQSAEYLGFDHAHHISEYLCKKQDRCRFRRLMFNGRCRPRTDIP